MNSKAACDNCRSIAIKLIDSGFGLCAAQIHSLLLLKHELLR
jgi:hypothetical protein